MVECTNASSRISQYVNKAVTECENKKRVIEVQSRLDTKDFDQYCVKSNILSKYKASLSKCPFSIDKSLSINKLNFFKNLNITNRKLIYEGELEWTNANGIRLNALLFEDILIFLVESSDNEKRRYILRPLVIMLHKTKQIFTPVIPLSSINNIRSIPHEKRSFHFVSIIEDSKSSKENKDSSKSILTQMLFMLYAKSGDDRSQWLHHLQQLTGKTASSEVVVQLSGSSIDLPPSFNQQVSMDSQSSLNSNSPSSQLITRTDSMSSNVSSLSSQTENFKSAVSEAKLAEERLSKERAIQIEQLQGEILNRIRTHSKCF